MLMMSCDYVSSFDSFCFDDIIDRDSVVSSDVLIQCCLLVKMIQRKDEMNEIDKASITLPIDLISGHQWAEATSTDLPVTFSFMSAVLSSACSILQTTPVITSYNFNNLLQTPKAKTRFTSFAATLCTFNLQSND